MNQNDYANSRLKHQILDRKQRKCGSPIWALRPDQVRYLEEALGCTVVPYIFRITTKTISSELRNKGSIFKEIHSSKQKGNSRLFKKLDIREQKLLREYDIYYTPVKYKILFN